MVHYAIQNLGKRMQNMKQKQVDKMPTPTANAKDRLIDTAAMLFRRRGYHGIGLNELLQASKAPKGSLYYHFPDGKEQIAEAAIIKAGSNVNHTIGIAFESTETYSEGAKKLINLIADWFERSEFSEGCPITSVMLETVPASDRLSLACQNIFQSWIKTIEAHAKRLGQTGDTHLLATGLLIALEGAWIVARAQRSRLPFEIAAALFAEPKA
jgi:TetR/AcrR family transcriptional regulator, lmrAB and yxaGH operons repressor